MAENTCSPEMVLAHNDGLRREIKRLKRELDKAKQDRLTDDAIRTVVLELRDAEVATPAWAKQKLRLSSDALIPVACLSDIHYGEVVDPAVVNGVNKYNTAIARDRIQKWADKIVLICRHYVKATYPGIVVPLLGDLFSGSIHDELDATNEVTAPQALLDLLAILKGTLVKLANEFEHVKVVAVSGNHGRLDQKPRFKQAAYRNWDWLLCCLLERLFVEAGDKRITWQVAASHDTQFEVYGTKFNASHGEELKGGGGIQGALSPWMIGDYRKRKRARAMDQDYDYMLIGHWHVRDAFGGIIANGTVKGYDEYAAGKNLPFQTPQQQLFMVRHDGRIAYSTPLFLD